jgi:peroxiredoxin
MHFPFRRLAASLVVSSLLLAASCGGTKTKTETPSTATTSATDATPTDTSAPTGTAEPQASGPKAPDFTLPYLEGGNVSLSDFIGKKVVLINFWSTTCDPCLVEMPHLVELYNKHKEKGFVVLAVSLDGPESRNQVTSVVQNKKMNFPVLIDEETTVVSRFNPKKEMPFSVLIDRRGVIVDKRGGYTPGDETKLVARVAELMK